jgi:hypothetical protein
VTDTNVFQLSQPGTFTDPLTEVLRTGASADAGPRGDTSSESGDVPFVVRVALRQHMPTRARVENPQNGFKNLTRRNWLAAFSGMFSSGKYSRIRSHSESLCRTIQYL